MTDEEIDRLGSRVGDVVEIFRRDPERREFRMPFPTRRPPERLAELEMKPTAVDACVIALDRPWILDVKGGGPSVARAVSAAAWGVLFSEALRQAMDFVDRTGAARADANPMPNAEKRPSK